MNKKILAIFFISGILFQVLNSQDVENRGKAIAEIFTDFHYILNDSLKRTGFDMNRAHLGYNFLHGGDFSSTIIINIGSPNDLADGSVPKRYAFFREASICYTKEKLTINFGIVNTRIFDFQQRFWGKRYLGPEFQAAYGYGYVADLGVVIDYKITDIVKVDLSVLNGEGYTNIQTDNSLKTSLGILITTPEKISVRLYGDVIRPRGIIQTTLIAFAGFKNKKFSFGGEASYKSNLDLTKGHDVWGLSATGSYLPGEKSELFVRYDYTASFVLPGEELQWAYKKDGSYIIAGFQQNLSNNLKMALNYRKTLAYSSARQNTDAIYLNFMFRF